MTIRTWIILALSMTAAGALAQPVPAPAVPNVIVDVQHDHDRSDNGARLETMWRETLDDLEQVTICAIILGVIAFVIRALIDYLRWARSVKLQTDVHTKLLDRLTGHEDLLAYIQSPAGSKFLQSSPFALDAGPRSLVAPLGRILWSVQAGVVLTAAGIGLQFVSARVSEDASQPLHAMGVLAVALGLGFVAAAAAAYWLSRKLGLIEASARPNQQE
jgi:hypothetical protein